MTIAKDHMLIQQAYGTFYDDVKDAILEDGWIPLRIIHQRKYEICYDTLTIDFTDDSEYWRPRALRDVGERNSLREQWELINFTNNL